MIYRQQPNGAEPVSSENPSAWMFDDYGLLDDLPSLDPSTPIWSSNFLTCSNPLREPKIREGDHELLREHKRKIEERVLPETLGRRPKGQHAMILLELMTKLFGVGNPMECAPLNGQCAVVGSYRGSCRLYNASENKSLQQSQIKLQNKKKKSHQRKIIGFQFAPGSSSEVLVTSADSQIWVVD
ncbi:hypothetical protein F3Y22_tig00111070pilonHSYRG00053 [Hibiscus syriacus]|uniref:Uncharacterized protein n=1 Tax=Hibiscus syriacus TaxID=106335 RepID=A0A6A2Z3E1_HIBSY|nr:hypothetical protein F3Y22_tig00111070pilonHSYRG00053 [Hibiscus syriacus]